MAQKSILEYNYGSAQELKIIHLKIYWMDQKSKGADKNLVRSLNQPED
jgi:hypothetical protein